MLRRRMVAPLLSMREPSMSGLPRVCRFVAAAVVILGIMATPSAAQDAERVREAIESAKASLKQSQNDDGSWPNVALGGDPTGLSALALLNGGEKPDSKAIQRALAHIRDPKRGLRHTYEVSLELMVLSAVDPAKDFDAIRNRAKWMVDSQIKGGVNAGMWDYGSGRTARGGGDNSNSQFALLGLYEADRAMKRLKK